MTLANCLTPATVSSLICLPAFPVPSHKVDKRLNLRRSDVLLQQLPVVMKQRSNCIFCEHIITNLLLHERKPLGYGLLILAVADLTTESGEIVELTAGGEEIIELTVEHGETIELTAESREINELTAENGEIIE